ncbi:hypothetical protein KA037_01330 [Patescibacteria group bacterium]|nr:hypothetical protein [Patescibacteria group bacterium]MBP7841306.1 hypothetical protein [Patescibacteria group bacterium]
MMNKKIVYAAVVATMFGLGSSFASDVVAVEEPKMASDAMYVDPYYGQSTYKFDEAATKKLLESKGALLQLKCNPKASITAMGLTNVSDKLLSVGMADGSYEYNFDFRSCALWVSNPTVSWDYNKSITEKDAIAKATDFVQKGFLKGKIYDKLGEAKVLYRNSNQPMPYYDMQAGVRNESDAVDYSDIVIVDDAGSDEVIEKEYYSFSIVFPYLVNGKQIYNQWGGPAGLTVEVSANGVMSANVQLLPFVAIKKESEKFTADEAVAYVKRGGNNPFYGAAQEIKLDAPQRAFVLFSLWRNNKNEMYLSSGIRFGSSLKTDVWAQQPYEMIISDYKIGNPNYTY